MRYVFTQAQAQAMIDAVDEGNVAFSTGSQNDIAYAIVEDMQVQLYDDNNRIVIECGNDEWDTMLTLAQLQTAT